MYLTNEALRRMDKLKSPSFTAEETQILKRYRQTLDRATKFIPTWVKVIVAIALGLGTMVAWKRIVVTVGERIGKAHLTYAQVGRNGRDDDDRCRRSLRATGEYHAGLAPLVSPARWPPMDRGFNGPLSASLPPVADLTMLILLAGDYSGFSDGS